MFQVTYIVHVFLIINILYNRTASCFESFYGLRTTDNPKTSCLKIANIETVGRCLGTCGITMKTMDMISHDQSSKTCMCCSDLTGSDITGLNWKAFVLLTLPCKDGYVAYNYIGTQICLKYVSTPSTYPEATEYCQADGGDLTRLDSKRKHDILTEMLVPIANGLTIDVWIQGTKVEGEWFFHDGSQMSTDFNEICPLDLDGTVDEINLRAHGSTSFFCWDMIPTMNYSFLCEHYRHLPLN